MITDIKLKEILYYNPDTGIFIWKINIGGCNIGDIVGDITGGKSHSYIVITINNKEYPAHRLIWLYMYGNLPKYYIDHINGIRNDNRLCNLREATRSQNGMNRGKNSNNTSGYKGVTWKNDKNKWKVYIVVNKKQIHIGYYDNVIEAADVYKVAAIKYHGEFARVDSF